MQTLSVEHKLLVVQEKLLRLTPAATPYQELPDGTGGISVEGFLQADTTEGMRDEEEEEGGEEANDAVESRRDETTGKRSAGAISSDSRSSFKKARSTNYKGSTTKPNDEEEDVLSQSSVDSADLLVSVLDPTLHLVVMTHAQVGENFSLLSDVRPSCVILYDPEVAIIRAIEAHQAVVTTPLKLYFLLYGEET